MRTETLGWLLFGVQSAVYIALCYVYPFRYVLRSGRFWGGLLIGWGTAAAFTFCSMQLGWYLYHHVDHALAGYCFEGPHFLAFTVCGWWQGGIISGVALIIHRRRKRLAEVQVAEPTAGGNLAPVCASVERCKQTGSACEER